MMPNLGSRFWQRQMRKYRILEVLQFQETRTQGICLPVPVVSDPSNLAMMAVESGLTLSRELENTDVWKMFFSTLEKRIVVGTPSLLGETLKDRLEKGGIRFKLEV